MLNCKGGGMRLEARLNLVRSVPITESFLSVSFLFLYSSYLLFSSPRHYALFVFSICFVFLGEGGKEVKCTFFSITCGFFVYRHNNNLYEAIKGR